MSGNLINLSQFTNPQAPCRTYFEDFFAQYPGFLYIPTQPIMFQLLRLCIFYGWELDSDNFRRVVQGAQDAIAKTFNTIYGTDVNSLDSWHNLCRMLYIDPLPKDIMTCKQVRYYLVEYRSSRSPSSRELTLILS